MYIDYFVACSQYCYTRPANYRHMCPAQGCQYPNFPGSNLCSTQENRLPTAHIFSSRTNIITRSYLLHNFDPFAFGSIRACQLYLYYSVGPGGTGAPVIIRIAEPG